METKLNDSYNIFARLQLLHLIKQSYLFNIIYF